MAVDYAPTLKQVLSAAASALNEAGRPPGRVELIPGLLPAWDDCCEGQLYLRVIEIYPTAGNGSPFPQIDTQQRGAAGSACAIHALAVHIGLGIIRCVHSLDDEGVAPKPEQVTNDGTLMLADMADLLDVLVCEVPNSVRGVMALKIDRWTPQGAEGGCAGGEWSAYLAMDPCLCGPGQPEG